MTHWLVVTGSLILALLLLMFLSAILDHYRNMVGWDLVLPIRRARRNVRKIVLPICPSARVSRIGVSHIDPKHFCILIDVTRDAEKHSLLQNREFERAMRQAVLDAGYPVDAVPLVGFSIESQETVDRDFGGNWYYARK
jgi:hypothetical protein